MGGKVTGRGGGRTRGGKRAKKQHSDGFRRRGKCDPLVSSTFFLARDAKIFERFLEPRLRRGEANCAENHPTLSVFWANPQRLNTRESGQRHRMYRPVSFPRCSQPWGESGPSSNLGAWFLFENTAGESASGPGVVHLPGWYQSEMEADKEKLA